MRQYELTIRIAQIHHLIEVRKYKKALAVVKTLDMRQVKGISDLSAIAEVYTKTEQFDAAKNTYLRIYKKSRTRRVLYRLIYLAIRTNALDEAEGYYQEFVAMNSSQRDALILRYRIDKASGASIGRLIGILESLKEEEYIEEWAYELAKLYFKAGRFDECRSECEDIKLWFGRGEIVERAKRLIAGIDDDEQFAYIDDRDYTIEKEMPNPEDTGSLPDLTEYVESESEMEKHDKNIGSKVKKAIKLNYEDDKDFDESLDYLDEQEETDYARDEAVDELLKMDGQTEKDIIGEQTQKNDESAEYNYDIDSDEPDLSVTASEDISDESPDEENAEDFDGAEMARKAIDGLQRLSGIWKHSQNQTKPEPKFEPKTEQKKKPVKEKKEPQYVHHSQSGTGITLDLSKEISAIYEAEKREQLKVHSIKVNEEPESDISDTKQPDILEDNSVISREDAMAPSDIEEIKNDLKDITGNIFSGKKRRIVDAVADDWGHTKPIGSVIEAVKETETNEVKQPAQPVEEDKEKENPNLNSTENTLEQKVADIPEKITDISENIEEKSETEIKLEKAAKLFGINSVRSKGDTDMAEYSTPEEELPTTRALHKTFKDVLTLINAEKDPSHFVLIGEDTERIVAVSKKIVKVLKQNGFLSKGRIGCIKAKQLNQMDFDTCREQLKGSCLLVDDAADLFFPTITKIFELMDEFYGDFIVILADEGNTLDQMFRFAPALAKKFKYVIDISRYTAEDLN